MISQISTAKEVATEICQAVGDLSDATYQKAYNCINRALSQIVRRGSWPFFRAEDELLVTVASQQYYRLRPRVRMPRFLHMRNPALKLKYFNLRDLRLAFPDNTETTGNPLYWSLTTFRENSAAWEISFWPIPDGAYNVYMDVDQNPLLISNQNDVISSTTGLPPEMVETLICIATALMYEKTADADYAGKWAQGMQMLEDDYYRMNMNIDDDLSPREYGSDGDGSVYGPIFGPKFDSP